LFVSLNDLTFVRPDPDLAESRHARVDKVFMISGVFQSQSVQDADATRIVASADMQGGSHQQKQSFQGGDRSVHPTMSSSH
jgi:hypothetical protein